MSSLEKGPTKEEHHHGVRQKGGDDNADDQRGEQGRSPAFLGAMNTRQWDIFDELLVPDVARHCQATPEINVQSLEQFKDFCRRDAAVFPDSMQTFMHLVAEGAFVAVWATYEGVQTGQMGPFPPSGKKVRFDFGAVFRVENCKPDRMSNQEFFGIWKQEATAALEALKAGVIKQIWKVPGKYEVFLVVGVDSVDQMDEIMHSLPIWKLGYDYIVSNMEWIPLRPYEHWAKQLDELSAG